MTSRRKSRAVGPRRGQRGAQGRGKAGLAHRAAQLPVTQRIDSAAKAKAKGRSPAGHRFHKGDAETFAPGRHDVKVARPVQVGKILIRDESEEPRDVRRIRIARQPLKPGAVPAGAGHEINEPRIIPGQVFQQRYYQIVSLVALPGVQPGDCRNNRRVPRDAEFFHRGNPVTGREPIIDGIVNDLAAPRINARHLNDLAGGMTADAKDQVRRRESAPPR